MASRHGLQMKKMGLGGVQLLAQDQSSALVSGTQGVFRSHRPSSSPLEY